MKRTRKEMNLATSYAKDLHDKLNTNRNRDKIQRNTPLINQNKLHLNKETCVA